MSYDNERVLALMKQSAPDGFVYLICHHERQAVKIGHSHNPCRRLRQIQTSVADCLSLMAKIPGSREMERGFHEAFAAKRMRGEWFDDSDRTITSFFQNLAYEAFMAHLDEVLA